MGGEKDLYGTYHLAGLTEDIEALQKKADQVNAGTMSEAQFKAFRVPMGIYEQRKKGTFMLRCRFPGGVVLPHQIRAVASASRKYGNGILHATTRQGIQIHDVSHENICPALTELRKGGTSTKGGGGNTVRNITGCPHAGVCADEVFDVTPHTAIATEKLIADPLSFQLPRKYKLAFSGCSKDCAQAVITDVGFIAKSRDGVEGFAVYAGGGLGATSATGQLLEAFIPVSDAPRVAEAVKRVFDKHGDRRHRHMARLRFLVKKVGFDRVRELYLQELARIPADGNGSQPVSLPVPAAKTPAAKSAPLTEAVTAWRDRNVVTQKQKGFCIVKLPLWLGDIEAGKLEQLATLVENFGEGALRVTLNQNFLIRWVHENDLAAVHAALSALELVSIPAPVLGDMTVCTGAATCQLGICLSRGLAKATGDRLKEAGTDLGRLGEARLHINGCPNSCGRQPVAQVGLFGSAKRVHGRLVPHYTLQIGGKLGEGSTRLASGSWAIPARAVPDFLADFFQKYLDSRDESLDHWLESAGAAAADELTARHSNVPEFNRDRNYYYDWDGEEVFSLAGRGPGECGAGVFDLIELDLAGAASAITNGKIFQSVALAANSLLVTRGEQPVAERDALALFRKLFIDEGMVDKTFAPLVDKATEIANGQAPETTLAGEAEKASALVVAVQALYKNMDASLRIPTKETQARQPAPAAPAKDAPASTQDFRTVACPLNYVKTKLALDKIPPGKTMLVLLNDEGAKNVPPSVTNDGHAVMSVKQLDGHWQVLIRKRS